MRHSTWHCARTPLLLLLFLLPMATRAASPIGEFFFPQPDTLQRDSLNALDLFTEDLTVKRVILLPLRIDEYRKIVVVHGTQARKWETVGEFDANLYELMLESLKSRAGIRAPDNKAFAISKEWGGKSVYLSQFRWNGWTLDGTRLDQQRVSLPFDSVKILRVVKLSDLREVRDKRLAGDRRYYPVDRAGGRLAIMPTAWQPIPAGHVRINAIYIIPSVNVTLPLRTSISVLHQPYDRPKILSLTTKATLLQQKYAGLALGTISIGYLHRYYDDYSSPTDDNSVSGELERWSKERFYTSIYGVVSGRWKVLGATFGAATLPDRDYYDAYYYPNRRWRAHVWLGGELRMASGVKLFYEAHDEAFNTSQPARMFNFEHGAWWAGGVRFLFGSVTLDAYLIRLDKKVRIPVLMIGFTL